MAKKINLETTEGRVYVLEFSRDSAKKTEALGFSASDEFFAKPLTAKSVLFYGALLMHNPNMTKNLADKILEYIEERYDTSDLVSTLISMYGAVTSPNADEASKKIALEIVE